MFAVVGTWTTDEALREARDDSLPRLVEGVRQNPGFVTGYWCDDVDDRDSSVTFVVFETREQAASFREAVLENVPAQSSVGVEGQRLRVVEVTAQA